MIKEGFEDGAAALFELCWGQLETFVERSDVSIDLINCEAVDEGMIFLRSVG